VPSLLLEVSMTGVPLVGSLAGGTGEVLREGLSWPVAPIDDIAGYEAGIRQVLADPAEARRRALELRAEMARQRTVARYLQTLETALSAGPPA
jgi:glycogen(starch) synthase